MTGAAVLWWMAVVAVAASAREVPLGGTSLPSHIPGRHTRFGFVPRACIVEVPSGSTVVQQDDPAAQLRVTLPNGDVAVADACPHAWRTTPTAAGGSASADDDSSDKNLWQGWPYHTWLSRSLASWTSPRLSGDVVSLSGTGIVPVPPRNTRGNPQAWEGEAPNHSFWLGVQGPAVLQPVLEFNTFNSTGYDLTSWNCCPSGFLVHSTPLLDGVAPGTAFVGSVVDANRDLQFVITSTNSLGASTTLTADMRKVNGGWHPTWAEVTHESYAITNCTQWPQSPSVFWDIDLVTTTSYPAVLSPVPWAKYFTAVSSTVKGPSCGGHTLTGVDDTSGSTITLAYDTHTPWVFARHTHAVLPSGSDVFVGETDVQLAQFKCAAMPECAAVGNDGGTTFRGSSRWDLLQDASANAVAYVRQAPP